MRNILRSIWAASIALAVCIPVVWAQKPDPRSHSSNAPFPPLNLATSSAQASTQEPTQSEQADATPDTRPLSGAEQFTLGEIPNKHSFLLPSADFYSQMDTNGASRFGSGQLVSQNSILGSLALQRITGRSQLRLNYVGGGTVSTGGSFSADQNDLNTVIQQLTASQSIDWRRWSLLLGEQMSYLPESSFGLGLGGLGTLGPTVGGALNGLVPGLQSTLMPDQSILTPRGGRISNTVFGQVEYHLSPRSSITTTGDYGILHFFDSGLLDSNNAMFLAGYDYQVTRRDTFGVIYRFSALRFSNLDRRRVDDHIPQLAYGHRITGRLAFRLAAGPEVGLLRDSVAGSSSRVSWNLTSSLDYQLERTSLLLSYNRGTTGGAGVLAGAETDEVRAVISRSLSRVLRGALDFGYANNRSLEAARSASGQSFNTWYGGMQLTRPIGRGGDIFLTYTAQFQNSDVAFCAGGGCGRSLVRHLITLGFSWHLRPIELR